MNEEQRFILFGHLLIFNQFETIIFKLHKIRHCNFSKISDKDITQLKGIFQLIANCDDHESNGDLLFNAYMMIDKFLPFAI